MPGIEKTVSITTEPESSRLKMMPITVTTGIITFLSACLPTTMALGQALGARGADVVLAQHLEHGRAGDAGEQPDLQQGQRDRRHASRS